MSFYIQNDFFSDFINKETGKRYFELNSEITIYLRESKELVEKLQGKYINIALQEEHKKSENKEIKKRKKALNSL